MQDNEQEEIFVVKLRVVTYSNQPTDLNENFLKRYFIEDKIEDFGIAHIPASKLKNFNEYTQKQLQTAYIATPGDMKRMENYAVGVNWLGDEILITGWLVNIKNTRRECKKTL